MEEHSSSPAGRFKWEGMGPEQETADVRGRDENGNFNRCRKEKSFSLVTVDNMH